MSKVVALEKLYDLEIQILVGLKAHSEKTQFETQILLSLKVCSREFLLREPTFGVESLLSHD